MTPEWSLCTTDTTGDQDHILRSGGKLVYGEVVELARPWCLKPLAVVTGSNFDSADWCLSCGGHSYMLRGALENVQGIAEAALAASGREGRRLLKAARALSRLEGGGE